MSRADLTNLGSTNFTAGLDSENIWTLKLHDLVVTPKEPRKLDYRKIAKNKKVIDISSNKKIPA